MESRKSGEALFRQASLLQQQNRLEEAIKAYAELLREDPQHLGGLNRLGICLMAIGRLQQAIPLFERACEASPESAVSHFNRGRVLAMLHHEQEARSAIMRALRIQPDFAMAWLHLGSLLARTGSDESAQACFQRAFDHNGDLGELHRSEGVPQDLRDRVIEARQALRSRYVQLHRQVLDELETLHPAGSLDRVRACVAIQHGDEQPDYAHPMQRPESLFFPGLPPVPWFERGQFPWVEDLESNWQDIRKELEALGAGETRFKPYVTAGPGVPDAMQNLAGSLQWNAFHFYIGGNRQDVNCARCPKTASLLESLPLATMRGVAPEAFFSALRPGAHIKPHHGVANTKLAVHLPLTVPQGCAIRVGTETRGWEPGKCLIFDDSFEHEAWNRGNGTRVVLIFEVWNPHLTGVEIEALKRLSSAIDDWAEACTGRLETGDRIPAH